MTCLLEDFPGDLVKMGVGPIDVNSGCGEGGQDDADADGDAQGDDACRAKGKGQPVGGKGDGEDESEIDHQHETGEPASHALLTDDHGLEFWIFLDFIGGGGIHGSARVLA